MDSDGILVVTYQKVVDNEGHGDTKYDENKNNNSLHII
jgi:hypothetical protein